MDKLWDEDWSAGKAVTCLFTAAAPSKTKQRIYGRALRLGLDGHWALGRGRNQTKPSQIMPNHSKLKPNQNKNLWASSEQRIGWALGRGRNQTKPNHAKSLIVKLLICCEARARMGIGQRQKPNQTKTKHAKPQQVKTKPNQELVGEYWGQDLMGREKIWALGSHYIWLMSDNLPSTLFSNIMKP